MNKSFQILVREHYEMLYTYALSLCSDRSAAEDVVQETFLVAYRRLDDFDETRDFGAWIRGIARNALRSERRKSSRLRLIDLGVLQQTIDQGFARRSGSGSSSWRSKLTALDTCLDKADKSLRDMMNLHYAEDLTAETIAEKIGLRVETVWQRLSRGRRWLKACIERQSSESVHGSA